MKEVFQKGSAHCTRRRATKAAVLTGTIIAAAIMAALFLAACSSGSSSGGDSQENELGTEADLLSFTFKAADNPALSSDIEAVVSGTEISAALPGGTNAAALVPVIVCSKGATVTPGSLIPKDFRTPVSYTVVSGDRVKTKTYTAAVSIPPLSEEALITSFVFRQVDNPGISGDTAAVIDGSSITGVFPSGTVTTALVPTITVSPGAAVSPASGAVRDFSNPVLYTVTAADGVTVNLYTATVLKEPSAADLIAHWPLDGDALDASGNGNNGTLSGAVFVSSRRGASASACDFNGTEGIMTTTTDYDTDFTAVTVSLWFKTTSGGGVLFGHCETQDGTSSNGDKRIYLSDSGALCAGIYADSYPRIIQTTASYNDGEWHHVVCEFSGDKRELYVDNVPAASDDTDYATCGETVRYWVAAYAVMVYDWTPPDEHPVRRHLGRYSSLCKVPYRFGKRGTI